MQTDLRDRNNYFYRTNISKYLKEYTGAVAYALNKISDDDLEKAKDLLRLTSARAGRVFVGGNGGSAAISDHLCCDFVKGTFSEKTNALQVHSLVSSQALFSAIGNDLGYDKTLGTQLEMYKVTSKDIVILISSSGNSKNIVDALTTAHAYGADVIGLSGFDGGLLKRFSNVSLHAPINNYGVVEDCHQILMHVLAQFYYLSTNGQQ